MAKDFAFWKQQILNAKLRMTECLKDYEDAEKMYADGEQNENFLFELATTFTSNVFLKTPKPFISPKIKQYGKAQNIAVASAGILEPVTTELWNRSDSDEKFQQSFKSALLAGFGVVWHKYEYNQIASEEPAGNMLTRIFKNPSPVVVNPSESENISLLALRPDEFLYSAAKSKDMIWWVARRIKMDSEAIERQFKIKPSPEMLTLQESDKHSDKKKYAECWEIWDRDAVERIYIIPADASGKAFKVTKDAYGIGREFPCEMVFLFPTLKRDIRSLYAIIKKILSNIETLNSQIELLEAIVKYKMVGSASHEENIQKIIDANNGAFIGLDIPDGKNIAESFMIVPVDDLIAMINHKKNHIVWHKEKVFNELGLSDITRGQTNPDETAAAQGLKAQFGSLRFNGYQVIFEKFIELNMQKSARIIAHNFSPELLQKIAGTKYPSAAKIPADVDPNALITIEEIQECLKDGRFNYSVDSSAFIQDLDFKESTYKSMADMISTLVQDVPALIKQSPDISDSVIALARLLISGSQMPKSISTLFIDGIEKTVAAMKESANNPDKQQPEPSPDVMIAADAEMKRAMIKAQTDREKIQQDYELGMEKLNQNYIIEMEKLDRQREKDAADMDLAYARKDKWIDLNRARIFMGQIPVIGNKV